jgi:hypothetical protein
MNTRKSPSTQAPLPQWSSQDLADAVPQRLSDLITPALLDFGAGNAAANGLALSPWAFEWRRRADLSAFRVR